ncbi:PAS domain-containing sensor histidine kinase [Mucilaginibacter segetis]|uniref:histidine kinase n=1 Tax=Mucilaginibacter segetis TaxID=2793071 RepID=A0A934PTN5_9SPHI|nr:ATP-binding protein [Mucilaginibacter segetis]MBK0380628.1 PAS domain-containing protein [Mucilaginibacter segetis]
MSFSEDNKFPGLSITHIAHIFNNMNAGIWEYNTVTGNAKWSAGFYHMLGYHPDEIACSYKSFFENLLYYHDKEVFLKAINRPGQTNVPPAHIRLLTRENGYQWFESTSYLYTVDNEPVIYGILKNINRYKLAEFRLDQKYFECSEMGRIAKIGSWEIDAATTKLKLTREIYNIYELQTPVELSVDEVISFFEPKYRPLITQAINDAVKYCKPFDQEVLLRTARNNVIWVRTKGVPVINDYGHCIAVRGVFQDIDVIKKRGLSMQSSINLLDDQNKRLQNFAYIVSHNLRSHAGNLKFMVNLFEETNEEDDQAEIFAHIKTISESFMATMGHLEEIVKIQSEISKGRKTVNFEAIFNNVLSALKADIKTTGATIHNDFSNCPQIDYIPAYLESIFQNFITNALKYKHAERPPVINCHTQKIDEHIYLLFEDNGIGIDLEKYGDQLFGLYKTFHQNQDAKGIGLFMTRNQVEALGGSIHVDSTVNVGTKFTIRLV